MFLACVNLGVQPSEFWNMTLGETFLLIDAHRPRMEGDYAGKLRKSDVDEISGSLELSDDEWWAKHGTPRN